MTLLNALYKLQSFYIKYDQPMVNDVTNLLHEIQPVFDKGDVVTSNIGESDNYEIAYRYLDLDENVIYYCSADNKYAYSADELTLIMKTIPKTKPKKLVLISQTNLEYTT